LLQLHHGSTPFEEILCRQQHGFAKPIIESAEVMAMALHKRMIPTFCSIFFMVVLILDSKTALTGAIDGIDLCLKVVIPSLFPFLILSAVLTEATFGMKLRFLQPLCRLCRIPDGAAPLALVGLIGGYPVGAQCITRAWQKGQLSASDARRMLGFCSNAGPAFIFGMTAGLFDSKTIPWVLWLIQIAAAIMTGYLLPGRANTFAESTQVASLSPAAVLRKAMAAMSSICGWVIVFRIVINFCDRWFLNFLPQNAQCLIAGILELTNGCCRLIQIPQDSLRFLFCTIFLSFGGIGVYMQTISVTQELGTGNYILGKIMQTNIAVILSLVISPILFNAETTHFHIHILLSSVVTGLIVISFLQYKKNNSRKITAQSV
jgi:hypothetical protein